MLTGIDGSAANAAVARRALDSSADIYGADLQDYHPPACEVVTLLDVLHHVPLHQQQGLIARIYAVLQPGGLLLIREVDADASMRFAMT